MSKEKSFRTESCSPVAAPISILIERGIYRIHWGGRVLEGLARIEVRDDAGQVLARSPPLSPDQEPFEGHFFANSDRAQRVTVWVCSLLQHQPTILTLLDITSRFEGPTSLPPPTQQPLPYVVEFDPSWDGWPAGDPSNDVP